LDDNTTGNFDIFMFTP